MLDAVRIELIHPLEDAAEHRAILGEHRKVAVLIERLRLDGDLLADDAAAADRAAHHPVSAAVAMIGAARAVLLERAPELRDDDHDRLFPGGAHLIGEAGEALAEIRQQIRELALRVALIHMRIPPADVDEADVELVAHQASHPPRLELESLGGDRIPVGGDHLGRHRGAGIPLRHRVGLLGDGLAQAEAFRNQRFEARAGVHAGENADLAIVERRAWRCPSARRSAPRCRRSSPRADRP